VSFIYPRLITIKRPGKQTGVGARADYAADQIENETVVVCDVPASIQARNANGKNPVGLPGDGALQSWRVLTPKGALAFGQVKDRDIVVDDCGNRFQVLADYSNSLGCNFIVSRLEA
jgi:hypothetical protein